MKTIIKTTYAFPILMVIVGILFKKNWYESEWINNPDNVFLLGIAHKNIVNSEFAKNIVFKGFPWGLEVENGTIFDYASVTLAFIQSVWFLSWKPVKIYDARLNNTLTFKQNGFKLINNQEIIDNMTIDQYKSHLINLVHEWYPNNIIKTKVFRTISRNVKTNGDIPVNAVHYDVNLHNISRNTQTEWDIPIECDNHEKYECIILGFWKPYKMKGKVCKDSLALLYSANVNISSNLFEYVHTFKRNISIKLANGTNVWEHHPISIPIENDNNKWFYFSNMTTDEMIIFTHWNSNIFKSNAHGAFTPNICDKNEEPRQSLESRVLIVFRKKTNI